MFQINSSFESNTRCVAPEITSSLKVPQLETTPRPVKRKLSEDAKSSGSLSCDSITEHCKQILKSAKRRRETTFELLSPIKDLPNVDNTKCLTALSTLFGETDDEEPDPCFQSLLNEESPTDCSKNPKISFELQIIPLETICDGELKEDILESPHSPVRSCCIEDENFHSVVIPIDRAYIQRSNKTVKGVVPVSSALHSIINEYDLERRLEVVKNSMQKTKHSPRTSHDIEVLRKEINQYLVEHWSSDATKLVCQKLMKFKNDVEVVISALLETIEDNSDDPINMENTPPAPPLPLTHQKLILVVEMLSGFIKKKLMYALERKIFSLKTSEENRKLQILMSLAYFYIGLTDVENLDQKISTARLFIYKSLYYYNHKSFPLIYAMLAAQPKCLTKITNSAYKGDDALVTTIKTILMNSPKDKLERSEFKKRELRAMLLKEYGYEPFNPNTDLAISKLIERLKKNQLKNVDHSLILLAKRYGYEWAMSKIIKVHLYPLLEKLMIQSMQSDIHDLKIVYCLRIISAILKTYPSNVDTTYFLQLFKTVLHRSPKHIIQEAAVEALLRFQRFGSVDVYQRIRKWHPERKITPKLVLMLKTFIYRKDISFWKGLGSESFCQLLKK